jgi:hypothetical protein
MVDKRSLDEFYSTTRTYGATPCPACGTNISHFASEEGEGPLWKSVVSCLQFQGGCGFRARVWWRFCVSAYKTYRLEVLDEGRQA